MWNCQQLIGMTVAAGDGEVGRLTDLCFDEERWVIRYFVIDAPSSESQVLIALAEDEGDDDHPGRVGELPEWTGIQVPAFGHAAFVMEAHPSMLAADGSLFDVAEPGAISKMITSPGLLLEEKLVAPAVPPPFRGRVASPYLERDDAGESLRRVEEVRGYRVVASDGDVGQIEGFLISESSWAIQFVVIRVREADAVRRVVIVPSWIRAIDRDSCRVQVDVGRDVLLAGPELREDVQEGYESWLFGSLGKLVTRVTH